MICDGVFRSLYLKVLLCESLFGEQIVSVLTELDVKLIQAAICMGIEVVLEDLAVCIEVSFDFFLVAGVALQNLGSYCLDFFPFWACQGFRLVGEWGTPLGSDVNAILDFGNVNASQVDACGAHPLVGIQYVERSWIGMRWANGEFENRNRLVENPLNSIENSFPNSILPYYISLQTSPLSETCSRVFFHSLHHNKEDYEKPSIHLYFSHINLFNVNQSSSLSSIFLVVLPHLQVLFFVHTGNHFEAVGRPTKPLDAFVVADVGELYVTFSETQISRSHGLWVVDNDVPSIVRRGQLPLSVRTPLQVSNLSRVGATWF